MSKIKTFLKCPKTGKLFDTLIAFGSREAYDTATLQLYFECPYCGKTHEYTKKTIILED